MSNEKEDSSDPLPYLQLDRSALPKAATLATATAISTNEAIGGLVTFWNLNSEPRELEALLKAGRREVVLSREKLTKHLKLAFGRDVDPDIMVQLGFLAPADGGHRVRGMSRQLTVIERRLLRQSQGHAGGQASAEARRARFGSAQPTLKRPRSEPEANAEAAPKQTPKRRRSGPEQEDRGQSTEVIDKRSEGRDVVAGGARAQSAQARSEGAQRKLSEQEVLARLLENDRIERCSQDGVEPGTDAFEPAKLNSMLRFAANHLGLKDKPLDPHAVRALQAKGIGLEVDPNEAKSSIWDQLWDVHAVWLEDPYGLQLSPPWSLKAFCSEKQLDIQAKRLERRREREGADDEGTAR